MSIINSNRKNCYTEKLVYHYLLWKQNLLTKRKCYVHKLLLNSNILIMTLIKNWNSSCIPPISLEIITQAFKYGIFGVLFHKYHLNEGTFKNQKLTWNRWTATKTIQQLNLYPITIIFPRFLNLKCLVFN